MAAPSRRRFLGASAAALGAVAAGAGALVGRARDVAPDPAPAPVVPAVLTQAIAREQGLLQHLAAGAATPGMAERTASIAADHAEHLRVLAIEHARVTGSPTVDPHQPSAPPASAPVPDARPLADQVAELAAREAAAAADGAAACLAGLGAGAGVSELHVLIGVIAASESVHAAMLQ